jgi:hypothetical protein
MRIISSGIRCWKKGGGVCRFTSNSNNRNKNSNKVRLCSGRNEEGEKKNINKKLYCAERNT